MPTREASGFYGTSKANFRNLIFRTILQRGPISRQKLSTLLRIRYVTLQRLLNELLKEKVIQERGNVVVRRGRAPIYLSVNPDGGRVVGVALEPGQISAVLLGLDMSELRTLRRPISSRDSAKAMQEAIVGVIEDLLRAPGKPARKLWGIGYAEYGLLDTEKGVTLRSTCHLNWHDIEVKRLLEGRFGVPASVDSIERCALFAERIWGGAREARTAVILDVEEGVGLAVLDKGDLLSGSRGFAGEIGHIQMVPDGELCLCGGRGCLEAVASTQAIVEQARRAIQRGIRTDLTAKPPEALTAQDVVESAARGDSLCVNIVDSALTYLGAALGIVINLYNPDAVILRGGIFRTHGDKLAEAIRREANVRALREFREGLQWHVSVMDNAPAKGAGARVFEELFEIETPVKT